MNRREENVEIELTELIALLFRKIWAIILAAALLGGCVCAYTVFLVAPQYTAETMLYVNNKSRPMGDSEVTISQGDLSAAQSLIETYGVILKSRNTLDDVIEQSGVSYTYKEMLEMISSEGINGTEVFHVEVTSRNPREAELLANTIAKVLPEKISAIVDGSSVRIIDYAVMPAQKSSPNVTLNTLLGILIGGFVACAFFVIRELRDDQIKDTDYILQHHDTPVLAVIPDLKSKSDAEQYSAYAGASGHKKHRKVRKNAGLHGNGGAAQDRDILGKNLNFAAAETYKLLRTNLEFSTPDEEKGQVIGVTSYGRGEGKTTTAINAAYTFAQTGKKVLLVEADMRLPNVAHRLKLKSTPGLSNLLSRRHNSQGAVQESGLIDNLWVVVAGDRPPNPAELLGSATMKQMLETQAEKFDVIIVDLPPVGIVSDALTVSKYLDGVVVVVREKLCTKRGLADTLKKLHFVNAKILGIAVTGSDIENKSYRHKKYGYGYASDYGYSYERADQ